MGTNIDMEVYRTYSGAKERRTREAEKELIERLTKESCGGLTPLVSKYLMALLEYKRRSDDEQRMKVVECEAGLANEICRFRGVVPVVKRAELFINRMQAMIAAGSFDPQSD